MPAMLEAAKQGGVARTDRARPAGTEATGITPCSVAGRGDVTSRQSGSNSRKCGSPNRSCLTFKRRSVDYPRAWPLKGPRAAAPDAPALGPIGGIRTDWKTALIGSVSGSLCSSRSARTGIARKRPPANLQHYAATHTRALSHRTDCCSNVLRYASITARTDCRAAVVSG